MQWGPRFWSFLHGFVEMYRPCNHERYAYIFNALAITLPCSNCRSSYLLKIVEKPFPCKRTKRAIQSWLIKIHNQVNRDIGKAQMAVADAKRNISVSGGTDNVVFFLGITAYNIRYNTYKNKNKKDMKIVFNGMWEHLKILFPHVDLRVLLKPHMCSLARGMRVKK